MQLERGSFKFRGLTLSYLFSNTSHKNNVILAHANGFSAGCYLQHLAKASELFNVAALDFAGHGHSEGSLRFHSWDFFRDQIEALQFRMGWETCNLVGHSLGGASAIRLAIKNPEKIQKIVAWDPVLLSPLMIVLGKIITIPLAKQAKARRQVFKSKTLLAKLLRRHPGFKDWDEQVFQDYLNNCYKERPDSSLQLRCDPEIEARIFSITELIPYLKLGMNQCPILLIKPSPSEVCPRLATKTLLKSNPFSQVSEQKNFTHFFPFEHPLETITQTMEFLKNDWTDHAQS